MSFLFHVGDLLLDGKEPIDDSVDKIVSIYNRFLSKTIMFIFFHSMDEVKLSYSFLENSSL